MATFVATSPWLGSRGRSRWTSGSVTPMSARTATSAARMDSYATAAPQESLEAGGLACPFDVLFGSDFGADADTPLPCSAEAFFLYSSLR